MPALEIADAIRTGRDSAIGVSEQSLFAVATDPFKAVTRLLEERARHDAILVDAAVDAGLDPGPLAGVPYAAKDLFDIAGLPTTAGSAIYAGVAPAREDAEAIKRLRDAGAVPVATCNMDEFAYGFATINATYGTTCNPHDRARLAGGSSGGSAAAVAAGQVPFSLGSDTNGSIRVPASLTGIYGLKPTHGSLPMTGVFPFAESFDDVGPFARTVADLRCVWEVLRGEPVADADPPNRLARLGGWFAANCDPDQAAAIAEIGGDAPVIDLPDIARARSAAFLITACEGGALHRAELARDAMAFDPATRDRLIAGALVPRDVYDAAQAFRREFCARIDALIEGFDVLLAPAAPCVAPLIADPVITIDGVARPARSDLGIHTQPISFAGLPSLAVPLHRPGRLPLGLQLVGRRGGEAALFAFAARLEAQGKIGYSAPGALVGELA